MIYLPIGVETGFDEATRTGGIQTQGQRYRVSFAEYMVYLTLRSGGVDVAAALKALKQHVFSLNELQEALNALVDQKLAAPVNRDLWPRIAAVPSGHFVGHSGQWALAQCLETDVPMQVGGRPYVVWSTLTGNESVDTVLNELSRAHPDVPRPQWEEAVVSLAKIRLATFHWADSKC